MLLFKEKEGKKGKKPRSTVKMKWKVRKILRIILKDMTKKICYFLLYSTACLPLFSLSPPTWLAVPLADRNCRVRDLSCSRRRWRLIRLPASPVAPDGATAGWMDMITHSQTGLTPPTASVFAVLFLISVSWPLSVFPLQLVSIPQCSCPCHSGVKSRQSRQ